MFKFFKWIFQTTVSQYLYTNALQTSQQFTCFDPHPGSFTPGEEADSEMSDLCSSALADILSEPTLAPPITVGLYARWGSGKSFILKKLQGKESQYSEAYDTWESHSS